MAVKKTYNRYFIIFQEEDKGFGIAIDKQPTGYLKIETRSGKCKITVYVQNLKKEKGPYICCMIDTMKTPPLVAHLGSIPVDDTGRGETWWEFNENNIADMGEMADRFSVAAILIDGKGIECPLSGFIGKEKVDWRSKIVKTEPEKPKEEVVSEEERKEAEKFKEYEDSLKNEEEQSPVEDKKPNENMNETDESVDNKPDKMIDEGENIPPDNGIGEDINAGQGEEIGEEIGGETGEEAGGQSGKEANIEQEGHADENMNDENINDENAGKMDKNMDEEINKDKIDDEYYREQEEKYSEYDEADEDEYDMEDSREKVENVVKQQEDMGKRKKTHAVMFHEVLKNFEEVKGLCMGIKNCRWWKIPYGYDIDIKENKYYPYFCAVYHLKMTYPYLNYIKYFKKCGYYYFGIKYDENNEVKYIIYGVKGMKNMEQQPYMGMTGFVKWTKINDGGSGMWLMYYDPYTGCIMVPKKKRQ